MKTVCGLIYKYGIPRNYVPNNLNLSPFLIITGEKSVPKKSFTDEEVELIKKACGKIDYADYIYCMIYMGFRINEFLALDIKDYNKEKKYIIGGSKTEAGIERYVTISPKIQPIIDELIKDKITGPLFYNKNTNTAFTVNHFRRKYYYTILENAGIEKPQEKNLTPHTCRRTFATLMKNINASGKDKLELMGHTTEEMLRYYQDVNIEDLRKITDQI